MDTNIRELRAHLSQYVRRAGRGETIRVRIHDREVARLMPPRPETGADALRTLAGVCWSGGKPRGMTGERLTTGKTLAEAVIEDRR